MDDITVRHSKIEDAVAIREVLSGPQAIAGTLQLPYMSESVVRERLTSPSPGIYSLVAECVNEVVGTITLNVSQRPRQKHVATFGMAVLDGQTGRGVGSALMEAVIDLAENWLGISRLELTVFVDNDSAIGLYKKYGFEVEGEALQFALRDGEYINALYMARIKKR